MSEFTRLARKVIESYVRGNGIPSIEDTSEELTARKAGVFVSLKKQGELRGCIGTIEPATASIAEEIAGNAVSSATRDPRFPPVSPEELDDLEYSVDILEEPEEISDISFLDPQEYGVIVRSGRRSGLLLPDLEGVDTPENQVAIARMKARISPSEPVQLYRFKVTRYR
ncbi:MAG: AmmeMemoRadiSam system protein A [Actinobacteria bacterium]|nr:AmmeMemoRadiSam system protein A [Actinomycetota bacterium]